MANRVIETIQPWYSVITEKADTKAQPTYFTKDDIMNGCKNYKRIENYGINKYILENQQIEQWRGSQILKLLVFCLNKKIPRDDRK